MCCTVFLYPSSSTVGDGVASKIMNVIWWVLPFVCRGVAVVAKHTPGIERTYKTVLAVADLYFGQVEHL